jgi:hypothetical protein
MQSDGFMRVSEALRRRLAAALPAGDAVHVGPLDDQDAATSALVLFLYRISVNPDLRNAGHLVPAAAAGAEGTFHRGSIPFDLHYVLSASPSRAGDDLEGLARLGAGIQALFGTPELTGAAVQGETVRLSLETVATDELGRVWSLFPTVNYRTSIMVLATPVWMDPEASLPGAPPVVDQDGRLIQRSTGVN